MGSGGENRKKWNVLGVFYKETRPETNITVVAMNTVSQNVHNFLVIKWENQ